MYVVWCGVVEGQECVDVVWLFRGDLFVYCSVLLGSSQVCGCVIGVCFVWQWWVGGVAVVIVFGW